jgi:hypothetical protein
VNNKFYIGMHKTSNIEDGYMGSGILITRAIQKYGLNNFEKQILHIFDNEKDMIEKEKELVVISEETYNLKEGGRGGFDYINSTPEIIYKKGKNSFKAMEKTMIETHGNNWKSIVGKNGFQKRKEKHPTLSSDIAKRGHKEGWFSWQGKKHSDETKKKIGQKTSIIQQGSKNSQYGTCWITNGSKNKKIKKEDIELWVNKGYYKGRV